MLGRGERRARTLRVCQARLRLMRSDCFYWDKSWEEYQEKWGITLFRYSKDRPLSCRCSKHSKGNPKIGHGICSCGPRMRVLGLRHVARNVQDLARQRNVDWDSDDVVRGLSKRW